MIFQTKGYWTYGNLGLMSILGALLLFSKLINTPLVAIGLIVAIGCINADKWYHNIFNGMIFGFFGSLSYAFMDKPQSMLFGFIMLGIVLGAVEGLIIAPWVKKSLIFKTAAVNKPLESVIANAQKIDDH